MSLRWGRFEVNLPVVWKVKLVGIAFAVNLLNGERTYALLAEFGALLAQNLIPVVEPEKGPVAEL